MEGNKIVVEQSHGGNLAAAQLTKYDWRIKKFLEKCEGEGTITIRDTGEEVVIDPEGSETKKTVADLQDYLKTQEGFKGSYKVNIRHEDGSEEAIKISDIEKTKEFGGGGGVAGGSLQTVHVEAGQCIQNAIIQLDSSKIDLIKHKVSLGKGETVESILRGVDGLDDSWKETLKAIGDSLVGEFGKDGYWHWQDSFVKSIEKLYASFEDRLAGKFDRYNPADIWYTDQPYLDIMDVEGVKGVTTLDELTEVLNEAYLERKVVGISLKKTTSPTLEGYTKEKRDIKFDLEDITIRDRAKGTLTLTIFFKVGGEENICQIRKNNKLSYRAGIRLKKGKEHFDGGCGMDIILHCLSKVADEREVEKCKPSYYFRSQKDLQEAYILNHPFMFDEEVVKEAESNFNGDYPLEEFGEPEAFEGKLSIGDSAIARALDQIAAILKGLDVGKQKEFLGRLARYSWSLHTRSCNFLKVH